MGIPVVEHPFRLDPELSTPLTDAIATMSMPLTDALIPQRRVAAHRDVLSDADITAAGCIVVDLGRAGAPPPTPILIARPATTPYARPPVLFSIHGGGLVAGHHRSSELRFDLRRAVRLGMAVASVEYRLAPEHGGPAAVEDCYAGLSWVARHATELGLDPGRIVVTGNSAGGGLAAGCGLLARDRGGPALAGLLLQSPMLDDRCDSASVQEFWAAGLWDGRSNLAGWTALLGDARGSDAVPPHVAAARAEVAGLPPVYVDVGSYEALRDEAVRFAGRIWDAGGAAELHVWQGAFHCFDQWAPEAAISRAADQARDDWVDRVLAGVDGRTEARR
ncbi:alpha/beta hydrolase fold domain-containing protein [Micromonospora sp. NPDC049645]|uniref:alpha/beta hydrolase fold domain-containing protein n=1 Tax=Micromonospora sp. NPDC049645 TaxID=3155508 RepID=UPI003428BC14